MKIKFDEYTVEKSAIENADWVQYDSGNPTTWKRDEYSHNIVAAQADDETWYDGIVATVPATDENGKDCEIEIRLAASNDETSNIYINHEEVRCGEPDDDLAYSDLYAHELAQMAGREIGGKMKLDYDEAVDAFIADHEGARYIMHNHRGFANEWTLWVCGSDEEAEEAKSATEDYTEYDAESARHWLRSGMMESDDYRAEFGLDQCCEVKLWSDYE